MSLPEVLLWQRLRRRAGGVKFRRQHPVAGFILDFYCAEAGLAFEIDGEAHSRGDRPNRDIERDAKLAAVGVKVVRIPASNALADADAVSEAIVAMVLPLHHAATRRGPPPHAMHGEDLTGAH
ncbi:endonuclease domain-containing protein [Sphingomonas sp. MMS24-J13]|uniref:endonuclease domain-containing protein n=1 Tax=Sphingomonas sp. MMS24-J13 TaxID=3238686 RepID=UPI00384BB678